jgi:hypothetical protein
MVRTGCASGGELQGMAVARNDGRGTGLAGHDHMQQTDRTRSEDYNRGASRNWRHIDSVKHTCQRFKQSHRFCSPAAGDAESVPSCDRGGHDEMLGIRAVAGESQKAIVEAFAESKLPPSAVEARAARG